MNLSRLGKSLGGALLATFLLGCSGENASDRPDETGSGGSVNGTGGAASATGGAAPGAGGSSSDVSYEEACNSFCTAFEAECGVSCPERCDSHEAVYGESCENIGIDWFQCMESATPYDCDTSVFRNVTDECDSEQVDLFACAALKGERCERDADEDPVCQANASSTPYGFRCVSTVVPNDCVFIDYANYCCPNE